MDGGVFVAAWVPFSGFGQDDTSGLVWGNICRVSLVGILRCWLWDFGLRIGANGFEYGYRTGMRMGGGLGY